MHNLYNFYINFRYIALLLASFFSNKTYKWMKGRKELLEKIALSIDHDARHIWFHCTSAGELEQARPILERFRAENPECKIVVTFSSFSGYEMRKNYPLADHVFYLPPDTPANAQKFIEYLNPRMAIFVNHIYQFNYINLLHKHNIPTVCISVLLSKDHVFFKWWGGWFTKQLKKITYFFVKDKMTQQLLYDLDIRNVVVSGDTRFDRVFDISQNPRRFETIEKFIQGSVIFLAGSTGPADDHMMASIINRDASDVKYIIVPWEINQTQIEKIKHEIQKPVVVFSEYNEQRFMEAKAMIVDQTGMLANLYQYASVAYIGGGFGKGIHNILEAATFGMPVIFGPNYAKITEATDMVSYGCAFSVSNERELWEVCLKLLGNYNTLKETSDIARNYISMKRGATQTIVIFLNAILNPMNYKTKAIDMINMN